MKVLVVTTWFPGPHNPAEAPFIIDHIRSLQSLGHLVRVVHVRLTTAQRVPEDSGVDGTRRESWDGIDVLRIRASPRRPVQLFTSILTIVRELRFADVLHTMAFSSILPAVVPWIVCRTRRSIPWVHTEHWTGALDPASVSRLWERLAWIRRLYIFPHQVTGVGAALADAVAPFARRHSVSVVPCVVRVPPSIRKAEYGEPLRLVAVGALIDRKRPLTVVETVRWLRGQGHDVELTWVGDGPLRAECELLSKSAGLEEVVNFVGAVAPKEVTHFLSGADLFVLPSEHETFFASAAEAVGAGRAVVISRLDGLGDFLNDSNSILVDGAEPEELGRAVLEARTKFRFESADAIAAPIRAAYSVEAVGEQFRRVYSEAVARGGTASSLGIRAVGGVGRTDIMDE